ncbi:MAG: T9SS type A sorting domain-containing protein [Bacteroidetes bacterium]|nr:T9SS type A sorting domain-containing protein [Bacteroidota bacterium]
MKFKSILSIITVTGFCCMSVMSKAQCISKFPYYQDFENFDSIQANVSCEVAVLGDTSEGWSQDQYDGGEWRIDTAGTPTLGTGPGATALTSGLGTGTDYDPGTTSGKYFLVETGYNTSGYVCSNVTCNLISPCFDFSAKATYYQLSFAYHMFGSDEGSLHIDVYDGSNWKNDVWTLSGSQGTSWKIAKVGLKDFNGSKNQIRFRYISGGFYNGDCAIDAVKVDTYNPLDYDGILTSVIPDSSEYSMVPLKHMGSYGISSYLINKGNKDLTGVKVKYQFSGSADSITVGSVAKDAVDSAIFTSRFTPSSLADSTVIVTLAQNEKDGDPSNNTIEYRLATSDGILARDKGLTSGGLGFSTTGTLNCGQLFELRQKDTLSSVSFLQDNPAAGDSVKIIIYSVSGGIPQSVIYTSQAVITISGRNWRTAKFSCEPILAAGTYYVALQQYSANTMRLGFSPNCYTSGAAFYYNNVAFVALDQTNFPVCFLIRLNLKGVEYPKTSIASADTVCQQILTLAKGSGADTYLWGPTGIVKSNNQINTQFAADTSFNLTLKGTNKCGYSTTVSKKIKIENNPSAGRSNDTTICPKEMVVLKAYTTNAYHYVGGPLNTSYTVNPAVSKTYTLEVDSSNGCSKTYNVKVNVSVPIPVVNNDTTVCEAQPVPLVAGGGKSYQWLNGPATQTYTPKPTKDTKYIVTVTDGYGCTANDTVSVTITPGPPIKASNDTAICFGQKVTLHATGANSYEWTGGPKTADYNLFPIISKNYYVKGTGTNGCYLSDSVFVTVANIPVIALREDTTICEGTSIPVKVLTADQVDYSWNTGEKTQQITASPKVKTTYKVAVANTTGCAAEDSVVIDVNPLPRASIISSVNQKNVTFTNNSTGGKTYSWDFGDGKTSTSKNEFHKYDVHGTYTVKYSVTNECGSDDTTFTIVIENIGIERVVWGEMEVKPNPTNDRINVSINASVSGNVQFDVYDLQGRRVRSQSMVLIGGKADSEISLGELSDGVYMLHVTSEAGTMTHRIVLTK